LIYFCSRPTKDEQLVNQVTYEPKQPSYSKSSPAANPYTRVLLVHVYQTKAKKKGKARTSTSARDTSLVLSRLSSMRSLTFGAMALEVFGKENLSPVTEKKKHQDDQ
jgi:hypothetical protein